MRHGEYQARRLASAARAADMASSAVTTFAVPSRRRSMRRVISLAQRSRAVGSGAGSKLSAKRRARRARSSSGSSRASARTLSACATTEKLPQLELEATGPLNGLAFSCERQEQPYRMIPAHRRAGRAERHPKDARREHPRAGRNRVTSEARRALASCNAVLAGVSVSGTPLR